MSDDTQDKTSDTSTPMWAVEVEKALAGAALALGRMASAIAYLMPPLARSIAGIEFGAKGAPQRRPRRLAKKLAKRGGYMKHASLGAYMHRVTDTRDG